MLVYLIALVKGLFSNLFHGLMRVKVTDNKALKINFNWYLRVF